MTDNQFGLRLKELRCRKGLSQEELARLAGFTPLTVSRWETGWRGRTPTFARLLRLAEVLGVSPGDFGPGEKSRQKK